MTPDVRVERRGAVALVTVSNPAVKNALTSEMARDLAAVCEEIDDDTSIGCTLIQGAEGTFCSGADTSTWAETYGDDPLSDEAYAETDEMYGSFVRFGELKAPTIAAVRGAAVGAGLNLALAADLRCVAMTPAARRLHGRGHPPRRRVLHLVRRLAGREAAATLGLFSEEVYGRARRRARSGVGGRRVPTWSPEKTALEIAARSPRPLLARRVKRSFRPRDRAVAAGLGDGLEVERGVQIWTQSASRWRASSRTGAVAR